jgi:predicted kinase
VVDAVSARETERAAIREAARRAKVAFAGIFLAADLATRQRRVRGRTADASDATPEVARLQESYNIGPIDWAVIDASGTHAATLKRCQTHLIQMKTAAAV